MQKYVVSLLHQITIKHTTMKTQELINKFENEIKSIALFAKRINFDLNSDIKELVRLYINETKVLYSEENKEQMQMIIKSLI
jgi:hypothetical protein